MIKRDPSGWFLPTDDVYFPKFLEGKAPKHNGFMREHLEAALTFVKAWDCAIDVGAHCGFWSWDMAQRFDEVHAFEPTPATFACLERNLAEFGHVRLYNVAVGAQAGRGKMVNDEKRPGNSGSKFLKPGDGDTEVVALDSMEFPALDFLKIDVEGYEFMVLQGAAELIDLYRPVISLECTDYKFPHRFPIEQGSAQRWLLKRGYREAWAQRPDKVFVPC